MKLELKHLAPYLPYGLKYSICNKEGKLVFLDFDLRNTKTLMEAVNKNIYGGEYKPILRPLSDLDKDYTDYLSYKEWLIETYHSLSVEYQLKRIEEDIRWLNHCNYLVVSFLIENHFDVFGLIPNNLAIDINTL